LLLDFFAVEPAADRDEICHTHMYAVNLICA
jgi:hypothetical protein